ncbi:hypothetical protein LTR35_000883 [Friedmanniomyces endolithicus]|uniref:SMP domain-containing protein n=1 Tax=Friedmanniomyces endolithicus TaxID=329885 RepID=A0AAN6FRU6_9PEZI|nr:hypothetical protein LTS00_011233 [Friedmanniomyces endolithicus]KAK0292852.1 hypothetical protein LTR35_000883 [Friedmanniomyces endolithicus]KAK0323363.1 hypothetical protein LTR82_005723 [Friedmanniomyces endolithicus]KAK1013499.1 hypothetical protein LTR54_004406 [Friedmanniomyces endolithicus]
MPPKKNVPIPPAKLAVSSPTELEAIRKYLAQKPDFESLIAEAKQHTSQNRKGNATEDNHTGNPVYADSTESAKLAVKVRENGLQTATMSDTPKQDGSAQPHHPEAVKDFKSSAQQAAEKQVASTDDHRGNLGPVMATNIGEPASKEELRKRAEELNK